MRTICIFLVLSLWVFISCKKESPKELTDSGIAFVPTDVVVKTKGYYTIDKVFDFINSFDHDVEYINDGIYTSRLPSDSLQYVLNYLNAKPYTHNDVWHVTGYLQYQSQQITVFPRLFQIKNKEYQADWLKAMEKLQLVEVTTSEASGYIVFFHVPTGDEKVWVEKFKKNDFVEWAELNYLLQLNPWP